MDGQCYYVELFEFRELILFNLFKKRRNWPAARKSESSVVELLYYFNSDRQTKYNYDTKL
jgi:hypothetical protein